MLPRIVTDVAQTVLIVLVFEKLVLSVVVGRGRFTFPECLLKFINYTHRLNQSKHNVYYCM